MSSLTSTQRLDADTTSNRNQRMTVAVLSAAHFVADSYSSFLLPLLPLLTLRLRLTPTQAGLLIPALMIATSLMQPVYGLISDRYLRRAMAVWGPLVAAVFMSLIGLADTLPALLFCLIAGGIGIGAFHPQSAAIVSQFGGRQRATTMSIFSSAGTVGVALGPVLITSIIATVGLERSYLAMILGIAIAVLLWRYCPQLEKRDRASSTPLHRALRIVWAPLTLLYIAVVLRSATHISIQTYLPFVLANEGLRLTEIGWVLSLFIFFGGIGGLFGGTLADRWGARRVSMLSLLIAAPFLAAAMLADGGSRYLLLSIGGTFLNVGVPVNVIMAQRLVPGGASTVSALMMGFAWGAGGLLTPLTGLLSSQIGFTRALFFISVLPFVASLFLILFPRDAAKSVETMVESTEECDLSVAR